MTIDPNRLVTKRILMFIVCCCMKWKIYRNIKIQRKKSGHLELVKGLSLASLGNKAGYIHFLCTSKFNSLPAKKKGHIEEWGEVGEELEGEHLYSETLLRSCKWSGFLWWRQNQITSLWMNVTAFPHLATRCHARENTLEQRFFVR